MLSTTVPAYAYWAGHSYYPTLLDPQGTASLAMVVLVFVLVALALLSFRFWIHRKTTSITWSGRGTPTDWPVGRVVNSRSNPRTFSLVTSSKPSGN